MLAKISRKNQLTLPKKVVEQLQLGEQDGYYVDVEVQGNTLVIKPVTVIVEEKIPAEQLEKFHAWSLDHEDDVSFDTAQSATEFLKNRLKKS